MKFKMPDVLVLATSRHSHGGISSVVMAHERTRQWREHRCRWIPTHRSGSMLTKLAYLAAGMTQYLCFLPWCRIVHIHTSEPPSARRKWLFARLALLARKKVVVHFHAFDMQSTIESSYKEVYRKLFGKSDRLLLLSPTWERLVGSVFDLRGKMTVLYNPCPQIYKDGIADASVEYRRILYAGVLNRRKGYAELIRAFARIAPRFPDWKLVFAGSGEIYHANALARELGIASQVEFTGWVAGETKDRLFRKASVFCLPSYAEGFPMAVLEAWAYGLPVVATPVGGLPDIVTDGREALLFEPGDCEALAGQLEQLMSDSGLRERMKAESLRLANEDFNIETIGRRLGEIYDSLLRQE